MLKMVFWQPPYFQILFWTIGILDPDPHPFLFPSGRGGERRWGIRFLRKTFRSLSFKLDRQAQISWRWCTGGSGNRYVRGLLWVLALERGRGKKKPSLDNGVRPTYSVVMLIATGLSAALGVVLMLVCHVYPVPTACVFCWWFQNRVRASEKGRSWRLLLFSLANACGIFDEGFWLCELFQIWMCPCFLRAAVWSFSGGSDGDVAAVRSHKVHFLL